MFTSVICCALHSDVPQAVALPDLTKSVMALRGRYKKRHLKEREGRNKGIKEEEKKKIGKVRRKNHRERREEGGATKE